MPDEPNIDSGAAAEQTFVASKQAQSDQQYAAAYLGAHPEEAESFGVVPASIPAPSKPAEPQAKPADAPAAPAADIPATGEMSGLQRLITATQGPEGLQKVVEDVATDLHKRLTDTNKMFGGAIDTASPEGQKKLDSQIHFMVGQAIGQPDVSPVQSGGMDSGVISAIVGKVKQKLGYGGEAAPPASTILDSSGQPMSTAVSTEVTRPVEGTVEHQAIVTTKSLGLEPATFNTRTHDIYTSKADIPEGIDPSHLQEGYVSPKGDFVDKEMARAMVKVPPSTLVKPTGADRNAGIEEAQIAAPDAAAGTPAPAAATPEAAVNELAQRQIEALKIARVGERTATEFGRPDIATVVPEAQTLREAQNLRTTLEVVRPEGVRRPQLAAETAAKAGVYIDEGAAIRTEAERLGQIMDAGGVVDPAEHAALANRFSAFAVDYANVAGMRSEMGRGLQILDPLKPQNMLVTETAKLAQQLNPDDLEALVTKLRNVEPEVAANAARMMAETVQAGRSVSGMVREYFYNSLMSRPTTLVKKIAGDVTSLALNYPTRAIAARIPSWGSAAPVAVGEANAFAAASVGAYEDALHAAKNTWNLGSSAMDALGGGHGGEFEMPMPHEIRGSGDGSLMDMGADLLGTVVRTPTRTVGTAHEFPRFINFRGEARALALRGATAEAAAKGLEGGAAATYIARSVEKQLANMSPDLMAAAHSAAAYNVYSQPLGPTGQAFNDWLDKLPAGLGRIAFPFRRIPVNLAKFAIGYSPVAVATKTFWSAIMRGGADGQLALAKLGMGSAASVMMAKWAMDGHITGGGPTDPKQYHDLIATGWKPYALHVGDHYFTYQNLEPIAMPMGMAADFGTIMSMASAESDDWIRKTGHAAVALSVALGRNSTRQSYVQTLSNVSSMIDDLRRGTGTFSAIEKFGAQEISGLIPAALRGEAKREDPVMRDTRGFFDTLLSGIPGYSKNLPPRRDLEANPILTPPGFLANEVYPFQIGAEAHNEIASEVLKTNAAPQKPPDILPGSGSGAPTFMHPNDPNVGVPLDKWQQDRWQVLRASYKDEDSGTMKDALHTLFQDPEYKQAATEDQAHALEHVVLQYGKAATQQLLAESPDLQQKFAERQKARILGHLPQGADPAEFLRQAGIEPNSAPPLEVR